MKFANIFSRLILKIGHDESYYFQYKEQLILFLKIRKGEQIPKAWDKRDQGSEGERDQGSERTGEQIPKAREEDGRYCWGAGEQTPKARARTENRFIYNNQNQYFSMIFATFRHAGTWILYLVNCNCWFKALFNIEMNKQEMKILENSPSKENPPKKMKNQINNWFI